MPEMTVVDRIAAFTVEDGDTLMDAEHGVVHVKSTLDQTDAIVLVVVDKYEDEYTLAYDPFDAVSIAGYEREEVFV